MTPSPHSFPAASGGEPQPGKPTAPWQVSALLLIAVFVVLYAAKPFVLPILLSFLLFFVFARLRRALARRNVPVWLIASGVVFALVLALAGVATFLIAPASGLLDDLPQIGGKLADKVEVLRGSFDTLDAAMSQLRPPEGMEAEQVGGAAMVSLVSAMPELIGQIVVTLTLLFFLILSGDLLYLKIVQSFDTLGDKRAAYRALREVEDSLGQYLGSITLINAGLGLSVGFAMWVYGMPAPALFGVLAFLLNFVPYLGAIAGIGLATFVALLTFSDLTTPFLVGATYLVLTSIEGQGITPYFVSRRLQMNPVVVFIAIAFGAFIWSAVGMVVAVPVLVVVSVVADHVPAWDRLANFLAGDMAAPIDVTTDQDKATEDVTT